MLRAPESRMDILSPDEIALINRSSAMVRKYSQVVDRESAYELLSRKVSAMEKEQADEAARKEWQTTRPSSRTSYGRSARTPQDQIVKVLTSATFMRGVFGILRKVMK
jgi:hypothetical protein